MEEGKKTEQIKQMLEERSEKDTTKPTALADELKEAKKYYAEKGSTVKVKSVFAKDGFYYPDDEEIYKLKHDFIVEITGVAVEKQDADFQSYLKDVAKKFDEKLNGNINDSLFLGLVSAYPELLSKSDLKWMVDNVKGKKEKFASLCDFILCYINPEKEPNACDKDTITDDEILKRFNFIWEIFKAIKSYGESWAKIGETYLDSLFGDDYVSFEIFTTKFFKKRRAKSFISEVNKYAAKYLKGGRFDLHSTEIYDHYRQVKKAEKKRNLIVVIASLVAVAALGAGSIAFIKSIDKSTVEFHGDKSIVLGYTYGDAPDLKDWYITYKTRDGVEHTEKVDIKMISGIDESKIGVQQTVTITFGGKTVQIQIRIDAAVLGAPSITRAGTDVTWEAIPNATGYEIYVTKNEITTPDRSALKGTVEQGRTSFNVADVCDSGVSNVYVRAIYTDGNDDETDNKYKNSALSNGVLVEKLGAVSGVDYDGTKLSWQTVDKADKYDVSIDGAPAVEASSASYSVTLKGGETVVITARSNNPDSLYAQSAQFTVLEAPTIDYASDHEGDYISWSGNGSQYKVEITGKQSGNVEDSKIYVSGWENGVYGVRVQVVGAGDKISSPISEAKFAVGYAVTVNGNNLVWSGDGLGSNFDVSVDGEKKETTSTNAYAITNKVFNEARDYKVSVVANADKVRLKTATITKLKAPEFSIDGTNLKASDNAKTAYKIGEGNEEKGLPSSFAAGTVYTVEAWFENAKSNEINSDRARVTVYKLSKPTINIDYDNGEKPAYNAAETGVDLKCYYKDGEVEKEYSPDSFTADEEYSVYGRLTASAYNDYTYVLNSDDSAPIPVKKYAAPKKVEHSTDGTLTADNASSGYTFYYRKKGSVEYTALNGSSVGGLDAGEYDICAVKNGGKVGNVYYISSAKSSAIQIKKANILFDVVYNEGDGVIITFREGSDEFDFSYIVTYWKDGSKTQLPEWSQSWSQLDNRRFKVLRNTSGITGVSITIKMNGVEVTNTWGVTK